MDLAKFGFSRRPFRPTPDTDLYCGSDTVEAVSVALQRAFASGQMAAIVDGEPGMGKTLLGLKFLEWLPSNTRRVILHTPPLAKPTEFFQALLFDMGKPYQGLSEQELRLAVHGEFLTALSNGETVAILVDEAHNLTQGVFEEIRLFGNLESKHSKAVFVLLVGLPTLREVIDRAASTGFEQRLAVRSRLTPLNHDESVRFIRHQVRECGGRPEWVISDESLAILADHCHGIPRVLNRAAGLAFEIAGAAGNEEVDAEAVHEALEQLGLLKADESPATVIPIRLQSVATEPDANPQQPIQLRRTTRTTQQSPPKKTTKRKSA